MSESFPLPKQPEGVIPSLLDRFNSGKIEAMMALYAPEAVVIANDGRTITDRTEIATQFQRDISLGLPLKAHVRHVFVADDTAQIVVDWSIDGKGPHGEDVHLGGSASDIVRRGADGFWRYIIDNNQGTAVRQPLEEKLVFDHAIPNVEGKRMVAVVVTYPAGGKSTPHHHAGSAFIYAHVLSGAIRSQVDDEPAKVYKVGEGFYEMPGSRHRISENASDRDPASLLAVFVVDSKDTPLTIQDTQPDAAFLR